MSEIETDRKTKLLKKREMIDKQIAAVERRERAAQRKIDTRRKIIVGGMVLARVARDAHAAQLVAAMLDEHVTRPRDREAIADLLPKAGRSGPKIAIKRPKS